MSQSNQILAHLKKGKTITPLEALRLYGTMRLAARINDLRNKGHNIACTICEVRNSGGTVSRIAKYRLAK